METYREKKISAKVYWQSEWFCNLSSALGSLAKCLSLQYICLHLQEKFVGIHTSKNLPFLGELSWKRKKEEKEKEKS